MNREEIKRRAELYFALAEGKTIQIKDMSGEWHDVEPEKIDCIPETIAFRTKPEAKYRPFKTEEECWNEILKHQPFGWIIYGKTYHNIWDIDSGGITISYECDPCYLDFKACMEEVTFTDGTPFGIKEEE